MYRSLTVLLSVTCLSQSAAATTNSCPNRTLNLAGTATEWVDCAGNAVVDGGTSTWRAADGGTAVVSGAGLLVNGSLVGGGGGGGPLGVGANQVAIGTGDDGGVFGSPTLTYTPVLGGASLSITEAGSGANVGFSFTPAPVNRTTNYPLAGYSLASGVTGQNELITLYSDSLPYTHGSVIGNIGTAGAFTNYEPALIIDSVPSVAQTATDICLIAELSGGTASYASTAERIFAGTTRVGIGGVLSDDGTDSLQVSGTASGSSDATTANQYVRLGQITGTRVITYGGTDLTTSVVSSDVGNPVTWPIAGHIDQICYNVGTAGGAGNFTIGSVDITGPSFCQSGSLDCTVTTAHSVCLYVADGGLSGSGCTTSALDSTVTRILSTTCTATNPNLSATTEGRF